MTKVDNWENEVAVLSPVAPEGKWTTLFKPEGRKLVSDVDLHFDGDRLRFSMQDKRNHWQIYELPLNPAALDSPFSGSLRQLTPGDRPEAHCYDAAGNFPCRGRWFCWPMAGPLYGMRPAF